MAKYLRSALAIAGAAALLGGCADYPYYDNSYGYYDNYYGPSYVPAPSYYDYPGYDAGPSIGLGFSFSDRDDRHHRHEWHGGGGGHDGRGRDQRPDDHGSGG